MQDLSNRFLDQYYLIRSLGSGTFGSVYSAVDVLNNERYAVKVFFPGKEGDESYQDEVASYTILSKAPECHKYITCLYDYGRYKAAFPPPNQSEIEERAALLRLRPFQRVEEDTFYLVNELMDGDLNAVMDAMKEGEEYIIHPTMMTYVLLQLLRGLRYIHGKGLSHRDIKPPNVLYKIRSPVDRDVTLAECLQDPTCITAMTNLEIKYGDLGLTCTDRLRKELRDRKVRLCLVIDVSPLYLSPELMQLTTQKIKEMSLFIGKTSDIWALAITMWEFLYLTEPPYLEGIETYQKLQATLLHLRQEDIDAMLRLNPVPMDDPELADAVTQLLRGMFTISAPRRLKAGAGVELLETVL